jgi:plastocyanin
MRRAAVIVVTIVASCLYAAPAFGNTITITVGPNGALKFSPASATIHPGDTVRWVWRSSQHSTTSGFPPGTPDRKWDSKVHNTPFTFSHRFTTTGTFHYFCSVHFNFGMVGAIKVVTAAPAGTRSDGLLALTSLKLPQL